MLSEANSEAFLPDLAMSLNSLGVDLSAEGRREEALGAAEEATAHYSALAGALPGAFVQNLGIAAGNLASRLESLGMPVEENEVLMRAVGILKAHEKGEGS